MLKVLYKKVLLGTMGGLLMKFVLDLVFYLRHLTYKPFKAPIDYVPAILLGMLFAVVFHFLIKTGEDRAPNFGHILIRIVVILSVIMPLRWSFVNDSESSWIDPEASLFVIPDLISSIEEWTIILTIIIAAFIQHLIMLYRFQQNKVKYSLAAIETFKKEQAEYRFSMLQSQVDPHFLFNSLNTLASLVHTDADAASRFVRRLSGVYRNVLQHSKDDLHSLKDELNLLEDYTELISIRFQDRVRFATEIDDEYMSYRIPPLTLQLLIENAVKHNVITQSDPLLVKIWSDKSAYLHVENANKPKRTKAESSGTGLKNIENRYRSFTQSPVKIMHNDSLFRVSIPLILTHEKGTDS